MFTISTFTLIGTLFCFGQVFTDQNVEVPKAEHGSTDAASVITVE